MYHHELSVYHYKLQCSLTVAVLAPDAPSSTGACRYPRRQASGAVVGDAASGTGRDARVTTPAPASNHVIFASTLPFPYSSEPHVATAKGRCPVSWRLWLPPVTYFSPAGGGRPAPGNPARVARRPGLPGTTLLQDGHTLHPQPHGG